MPRGLPRGGEPLVEGSKGEPPPWSKGGASCPARASFLALISVFLREFIAKCSLEGRQGAKRPLEGNPFPGFPSKSVRPGLPGARWKGETRSGFPLQIDFRGHDSLSLAVFNGIVLWGVPTRQGQGIVSPLHLKVIYGQDQTYAFNVSGAFQLMICQKGRLDPSILILPGDGV
jgi:hypothetical protein